MKVCLNKSVSLQGLHQHLLDPLHKHQAVNQYLLFEQQTRFFTYCTSYFPLAFIVSESQDVPGVFRNKKGVKAQESTQKTIQAHWFSSGQ